MKTRTWPREMREEMVMLFLATCSEAYLRTHFLDWKRICWKKRPSLQHHGTTPALVLQIQWDDWLPYTILHAMFVQVQVHVCGRVRA